ncbi:hypothetical protein BOW52_08215 [Solemya elarraichensis gill symbiont]|uniref:Uncharacterized protein n=1 Tax=Solemya elarraichensis gill symbiont TaxID=1918949 RepID=A0A1T2L0V3_9GAMM|nr:hypothetical protein BOW52_08215 [Solemya elarraichensis gill symbiont]
MDETKCKKEAIQLSRINTSLIREATGAKRSRMIGGSRHLTILLRAISVNVERGRMIFTVFSKQCLVN